MLSAYASLTGVRSAARPAQRLRLTAPVQFGRRHVVPIVAGFLSAHPGLRLELLLQDRTLDIVDEGIDVAIRIGPTEAAGLERVQVGTLRRILVAAPAYLTARGVPRKPQDLANHDVILGLRGGYPEFWQLRGAGRTLASRLNCRFAVDDVETLIATVLDGRGIARVLSYQVHDEMHSDRLRCILADFEPPPVPVTILTRPAGPGATNAAKREFVRRAAQALRSNPVLL